MAMKKRNPTTEAGVNSRYRPTRDAARLALIREVYEKAFTTEDSFENPFGGTLVYLFAAIAGHEKCDRVQLAEDDNVLAELQTLFPADHQVWQFIEVHNDGKDT